MLPTKTFVSIHSFDFPSPTSVYESTRLLKSNSICQKETRNDRLPITLRYRCMVSRNHFVTVSFRDPISSTLSSTHQYHRDTQTSLPEMNNSTSTFTTHFETNVVDVVVHSLLRHTLHRISIPSLPSKEKRKQIVAEPPGVATAGSL